MVKSSEVVGNFNFIGVEYDIVKVKSHSLIGELYVTIKHGDDAVGKSEYRLEFAYDVESACKARAEKEIYSLCSDKIRDLKGIDKCNDIKDDCYIVWQYLHHDRYVSPYMFS